MGMATVLTAIMIALGLTSAASATVSISEAERRIFTSADYFLDASWGTLSDNDADHRQNLGEGVWDISLASRVFAVEEAPDGIGRIDLQSDVSSQAISFASRALSQGGEYNTSGGDPGDEGSYYYTNENTWGDAESSLFVRFWVEHDTPYAATFAGVGRPADQVQNVSFTLSGVPMLPFPGASETVFDRQSMLSGYAGGAAGASGVLQGGWLYTLSIEHRSVQRQDMAFDFLLVIPEPGTAILLGLGLIGLTAGRDRSLAR